MKILFHILLFLLLIILTVPLHSQNIDFNNEKDYWNPQITDSAKIIRIEIDSNHFNIHYRYHIDKTENKIYIEKIELLNKNNLSLIVENANGIRKFMYKIVFELIKNKPERFTENNINDSTVEINIEIIKKAFWKISSCFQSNNDVIQCLLPCETDKYYSQFICLNIINGITSPKLKESTHCYTEDYYKVKEFNDKECVFMLDTSFHP